MSADDPSSSFPDPESPRIEEDRVLFSCETCGKELRTLRTRVGQTASCPQCGQAVTVPDTGVAPAPVAPPPVSPDAEPVACPMCGAENLPTATHCTVCGERLPTPAPKETGRAGRRFRRRVGTVSLGETFTVGGRLFGEHLGLLLGGTLLTGVLLMLGGCLIGGPLQVAAMFIGGQFGAPVRRPDVETAIAMAGVNQIGQLLAVAVVAFVLAGFVRLRLNLARRGRAKIDDLFAEREVWASAALTSVIYTVITALPGALIWAVASAGDGGMGALGLGFMAQPGPGGPPFDFDLAWGVAALVVFLVQMVVGVLFWPYLFLCVDYKLNGLTPLNAAWRVARGSRWQLLGLTLAQTLLMFVATIPCGLGLILAAPYIATLNVAAYEQISGNFAAGQGEE